MYPRLVVLLAPIVRVIDDPTVLVAGDLITLRDPFNDWLSIDNVVIGSQRDVRQSDLAIEDDLSCFPLQASFLLCWGRSREGHLLDFIKLPRIEVELPRLEFSIVYRYDAESDSVGTKFDRFLLNLESVVLAVVGEPCTCFYFFRCA